MLPPNYEFLAGIPENVGIKKMPARCAKACGSPSRSIIHILFLALPRALEGQQSGSFPPGWNGLARTPPMGWRSWNPIGPTTNQADVEAHIDLIAASDAYGFANGISLASLGYSDVGIDEGWEGCGEGVNGTQHDASGKPVIHTEAFNDTAAMVARAHAKHLTMGWYMNGCACGEPVEKAINYAGDVQAAFDFGFDGVKFDGCGSQNNMTLYAEYFNRTGKAFVVEDCKAGDCTGDDNSACATLEWCPFNLFRVSRDVDNSNTRWFLNLQVSDFIFSPGKLLLLYTTL